MSAEKLVRMANEIAAFFDPYSEAEAVAGVRDHIASFWTTKMIAALRKAADEGGAGMDPRVIAATRRAPDAESPTARETAGPAEVGEIGSSDAG